jgi:Beta-ketoacyl synthase, N-terminal domain
MMSSGAAIPAVPAAHGRRPFPCLPQGPARAMGADLLVTAFAGTCPGDGQERAVGLLAHAADIPVMLRRRLRGVALAAVRCGFGPLRTTAKPVEIVFCSRHGNLPRTQRLLMAMVEKRPPSPLEFSLSVHNALAGMLDLLRRERTGHTSIAAGRDSFAAALIEVAARLGDHQDRAMLLFYVEHEIPRELKGQTDHGLGGMVLAALIEQPATRGKPLAVLRPVVAAGTAERESEAEARSLLSVLEGGGAIRLASRAGFDWLVEPAR